MRENTRDNWVSSLSGLIIGFLSGLIGIGGGEYRAPILIYLLRLGAKFAIATNLLIGLFYCLGFFYQKNRTSDKL